jgi:hypothetical protein
MDFKDQFTFKPRFSIVVCKSGAFAVAPKHLRAHIAKRHALATCYATGWLDLLDRIHHRNFISPTLMQVFILILFS